MTVYKRKIKGIIQDEYAYKFQIKGKRFKGKCLGCTTKAKAEDFERKKRAEVIEAMKTNGLNETMIKIIAEKTNVSPRQILEVAEQAIDTIKSKKALRLDEAFDVYLTKPTKRPPNERQKEDIRRVFNDFLKFMTSKYDENTLLKEVKRHHAEAYITHLRTKGSFDPTYTMPRTTGRIRKQVKMIKVTPSNKQLSNNTINAKHSAIKAIFARLAEDEGIVFNPFNIPTLLKDTVSHDIFTETELQLIGKHFSMPYTKPIFMIGMYTGLRLKDICHLRWDNIKDGFLIMRAAKTKTLLEIPICQELKNFLDEIPQNDEFIFPELMHAYTKSPSNITDKIQVFLKSLGMITQDDKGTARTRNRKGIHSLRHCFCHTAGMYGIPKLIVRQIVGHMTPVMTELYQRHSRREDKERLIQLLPNVFNQPQKET